MRAKKNISDFGERFLLPPGRRQTQAEMDVAPSRVCPLSPFLFYPVHRLHTHQSATPDDPHTAHTQQEDTQIEEPTVEDDVEEEEGEERDLDEEMEDRDASFDESR